MNENQESLNQYFFQIVISLQAGAMQQMGKIASPLTGKVERSLDAAKNSIDMLGMLQEKTTGNLTDEEKKLLDHVLYELRLNYVEELKKGDSEPFEESAEQPDGERAETGGEKKSKEEPVPGDMDDAKPE